MSTVGNRARRNDAEFLSAECTVGTRAGFEALHGTCRQAKDVPLPHSTGLLLVRRCPCSCHASVAEADT